MTADQTSKSCCPECNKEQESFHSDQSVYVEGVLRHELAQAMVEGITHQQRQQIMELLDKEGEFEFSNPVRLHIANQTIEGIFKRDGSYHVAVTDQISGEGLFYDLEDAEIAVQDLICITAQIETQQEG